MSSRAEPLANASEMGKVTAFLRRDFLTAWSYRTMFFSDVINLFAQSLIFVFLSRIIDTDNLPAFGGTRASYLAFVTIGIAHTGFLQVGLGQMSRVIHNERLMGTLEALLMTPTRLSTLQLGWVAYDLVYVPLRTALFFAIMAIVFGVTFDLSGSLPAVAFTLAFLPFVWGVGAAMAAGTLVFRRGTPILGFLAFGLTFTSGAYFPLDLFPSWAVPLAELNPVALTVDATRDALLGGVGFVELLPQLALLSVMSGAALAVGLALFRYAFQRELRTGGVGLY